MKISLITATYNCEKLISQTLEALINQNYTNIEYIIIDGKSEDDTLKVIESYKDKFKEIRIISEPDNGLYEAMNKGIKLATGDIVGILNAGDYYTSNNILSNIVKIFEKNLDLKSTYGDLKYINEKSETVRYWKSGEFNIKKIYQR